MGKASISTSLPASTIAQIDEYVEDNAFESRSAFILEASEEKFDRMEGDDGEE